MMRRLLVLAFAVGLLVAPSALAKGELEAGAIAVCGPGGCRPVDDGGLLGALAGYALEELPLVAGDPAPPAPYYELRFRDEAGAIGWLVLNPGSIRPAESQASLDPPWYRLARVHREALTELTRGLEPYPTPTFTAVYVGERQVEDAAPYIGLLAIDAEAHEPNSETPRLTVALVTEQPTPWTLWGAHGGSAAPLEYASDNHTILVDGSWYTVPQKLALLIEQDASTNTTAAAADLKPPPATGASDSDSGGPWSLIAPLTVGALALAAALILLRRQRTGGDLPRRA
jgi:hypothetical protein